MAILPQPNVDYTDRDFDALKARLTNLVSSSFAEWTDFNTANFGNLLLELFAYVGDVNTYYMDNQAAESRIVSATQRVSLLGLIKLIDFRASGATAATADIAFSFLVSPTANDVVIPAGFVVQTPEVTDPVEYQVLIETTQPAGSTDAILITVEQSKSRTVQAASTGLANQEVPLSATPYLDLKTVIVDATGDGWVDVSVLEGTLLNSSATDKHFIVKVDQNDRGTIVFGNGANGQIPQGLITIEHRIGGGIVGNVDQGRITVAPQQLLDVFGNIVNFTITNPADAAGGNDRQSNALMRQQAPLSLRVLERAVAREDFEIVSENLGEVSRALMLTSNEDAGVEENSGDLYIIATGGGAPSQIVKDAVLAQFIGDDPPFPSTLTFKPIVLDAPFLIIDVIATIYLAAGASASVVDGLIRTALSEFFAVENSDGTKNTNVDYGFNIKQADGSPAGEIALSDVTNAVRDVSGVRKIGDLESDFQLNGNRRDVLIAVRQFPKLGTIQLLNGDTGLPLV